MELKKVMTTCVCKVNERQMGIELNMIIKKTLKQIFRVAPITKDSNSTVLFIPYPPFGRFK